MDDHRQQELERILKNRRDRGVLGKAAPATGSTVNVNDAREHMRPDSTAHQTYSLQAPHTNSHSTTFMKEASPYVPRLNTAPSLLYTNGSSSDGTMSAVTTQVAQQSNYRSSQPAAGGYPPTAAAFDNAVPQPMRQQSVHRSGSLLSQSGPPVQQPPVASTLPRQPSMDNLLRKGTFDNFREAPILVSSNIRPYSVVSAPSPGRPPADSRETHAWAKPSANADLVQSPPGRLLPTAAASSPSMSAVAAASFSKPNPFRSQTFEDFREAPHYDRYTPDTAVIPQHNRQQKAPSPIATAMAAPRDDGSPPLFDPQQSLTVLVQGDWFLKWTRIESAHRRYVWLDLNRGVLSWAKSRDSSFFMQKSIKLEDIMDLQPVCAVDEASGRTFYKLIVVSLDRILKIGTELRNKFDVWFDTMQRLCEAQRTFTNTYIGRHAANHRLASASEFVRRTAESAFSE